jgi:hypothetical protein
MGSRRACMLCQEDAEEMTAGAHSGLARRMLCGDRDLITTLLLGREKKQPASRRSGICTPHVRVL